MKLLPFFYFPTTFYLVDDHPRFPTSIVRYLSHSACAKSFSQPEAFVAALAQAGEKQGFLKGFFVHFNRYIHDREDQINFIQNLENILQEKTRFQMPAVVTIDYAMPSMTGLEVCDVIAPEIKKVLLTGEADHFLAVEAFNKNSIHRFIKKNHPELPHEINKAFFDLSYDFFSDLCKPYHELFYKRLPHFLGQLEFFPIFKTLFDELGGVEFYMVSKEVDYLCFDAEGDAFILSFRDDRQMDVLASLVEREHLEEPTPETEAIVGLVRARAELCFIDYPIPLHHHNWMQHRVPLIAHGMKDTMLYSGVTKLKPGLFPAILSLNQFLDMGIEADSENFAF